MANFALAQPPPDAADSPQAAPDGATWFIGSGLSSLDDYVP